MPSFKYPFDPRFAIKDFLNELQNEWRILRKHECFHQIYNDIIILVSQFLRQISKTSINIFVCAQRQETPIEFLQKLHGQVIIFVIFHTIVHLKK